MSDETARVTTVVAVHPHDAFEIFTSEIDLWWRRTPRHRGEGARAIAFEGRARLIETSERGEVFEIGRVLAWEPGARLAFELRTRDFEVGETTRVEVRFEEAPRGTRVTIEHTGWEAIPPKRRTKHGLTGTAFTSTIGLWWGELLTSLRAHAAKRAR